MPGVIAGGGLDTYFSCTSTDTAAMQVGVELFGFAGGGSINDAVATSLSVAAGATVIFGTSSAVGISISSDLASRRSYFGCANGLVLTGARVAWAMARDDLFFSRVGRLNTAHVPGAALWFQCAWASLLALSGRYGDLLDYVIIAELLFYLLTVAGLFVLARRTGERPSGVAYPWLQAVYLLAVTVLVADLLVTKPAYTWGSLAVVASGLPFFVAWRRRAGLRSA